MTEPGKGKSERARNHLREIGFDITRERDPLDARTWWATYCVDCGLTVQQGPHGWKEHRKYVHNDTKGIGDQ